MRSTFRRRSSIKRFAFYGKVLTGAQEQRARWKRALDETNDALGDALGKLNRAPLLP